MIYFGKHLKWYEPFSYRNCHWNHTTGSKARDVPGTELGTHLFVHSHSHACTHSEKSGLRGDCIM